MSDPPKDVKDKLTAGQLEEFNSLTDWLGPQVDLCDELQDHVLEINGITHIKHPLVNQMMHSDVLNHRANETLRTKRKMLVDYEAEKNWNAIVFACFERPWRLDGIKTYADKMTDQEFWEVVGDAWTDSENIHEFKGDWYDLLHSPRPHRGCMMDEDDQKAFEKLPTTVKVFRGYNWPVLNPVELGYSWTMDRTIAEFFAKRYLIENFQKAQIATGTASKKDLIAHFNTRGESEIVVLPEVIKDLKIRPADWNPDGDK